MEHLRFWQAVPFEGHEPIELYGSRMFVHLRDGLVVEVQSGLWRDAEVEQPAAVIEKELRAILLRHLGQMRGTKALRESLSEEDHAGFPVAHLARTQSLDLGLRNRFNHARGRALRKELDHGTQT
jgi:hypothetical protein